MKQVEIILATDADDPHAKAVNYLGDIVIEHPVRHGYAKLNEYYNAMAFQASGDWLVLWNDDAIMLTQHWDMLLENIPKHFMVAELQDQMSPALCCFPAVRTEAVQALGHFCDITPHNDTYWQEVGRRSGTQWATPICVHHERYDLTGLNNDETYRNGQANYQSVVFHAPPVQGQINADAQVIKNLSASFKEPPGAN